MQMLCELGTIGKVVRYGLALSTQVKETDSESESSETESDPSFVAETFCELEIGEKNEERLAEKCYGQ